MRCRVDRIVSRISMDVGIRFASCVESLSLSLAEGLGKVDESVSKVFRLLRL